MLIALLALNAKFQSYADLPPRVTRCWGAGGVARACQHAQQRPHLRQRGACRPLGGLARHPDPSPIVTLVSIRVRVCGRAPRAQGHPALQLQGGQAGPLRGRRQRGQQVQLAARARRCIGVRAPAAYVCALCCPHLRT